MVLALQREGSFERRSAKELAQVDFGQVEAEGWGRGERRHNPLNDSVACTFTHAIIAHRESASRKRTGTRRFSSRGLARKLPTDASTRVEAIKKHIKKRTEEPKMAEHRQENHEHHGHENRDQHQQGQHRNEQRGSDSRSVENPMPSLVHADRVINDVFGGDSNRKISREEIQQAASRAKIVPDVQYYFDHLPQGSYSKQELIDRMNAMIRERGREKEVGLFGVGNAEQEAGQSQRQHRQAGR